MATPFGTFLFLLTRPAQASCAPSELDAALSAAEDSFTAGDARAMGRALKDARRSLGCVREPLTPELCARFHLSRALEASLLGDAPMVATSLRAMLHADPLAVLPTDFVPMGHPVRYAMIQAEETALSFVEGPGSGWLLVDGLRTGAVPVGQPYVLQRTRSDGRTLGAKLVESAGQGAPNVTF